MALSVEEQTLIETRVANEGPSVVVAYVFWLFIGFLAAHRFYLGRPGSAILQIVLILLVVGLIWWAIDIFLIPGMVRERQRNLRDRFIRELLSTRSGTPSLPLR